MTEMILLATCFIATAAIGWVVLGVFVIRREDVFRPPEKLALSFIIGLGAITIEMFILALIQVKWSVGLILVAWLPVAFIYLFLPKPACPAKEMVAPVKLSRAEVFFICGILFQVFYVIFNSLVIPMSTYDAIANFALKSKIFYLNRGIPFELLRDSEAISHPARPYFLPLSEAWVYLFMNSWNDLLVKALFPVFFICLLTIFYHVVMKFARRAYAVIFTFMLSSIWHFADFATNGYADFPLSMFFTGAFLYLFLWMDKERKREYIVLSALLTVLTMWTKEDGLLLGLVVATLLALFMMTERRRLLRADASMAAVYFIIAGAAAAGWAAYRSSIDIPNQFVNQGTVGALTFMGVLKKIPWILYDFQKHVFGPKKWNLAWLLFTAGFILNFRKAFSGRFRYVTLAVLLPFAGYSAVQLISGFNIKWLLSKTESRLLLHYLPVAMFWIAYLLIGQKHFPRSERRREKAGEGAN